MSRLIVVDGYNLVLRAPSLKPGEGRTLRQAREKLINLLSWVVGAGEARFLVIFDGTEERGPDSRTGRVEVRFSRPPEKADDLIRAIVEDQVERVEHVTVVTGDLEVARHARAAGAEVALADLFLASVMEPKPAGPGEKPASLSKKELEKWVEIFRTRKPRSDGATEEPDDRDDRESE